MKSSSLILGIPIFVFLILSVTLDIGSLFRLYPQLDLTPFLAARSLGTDGDLAYSQADSDRFFRDALQRPSHFRLKQKKILSSSGEVRTYAVFYSPDLFVFALVPFVRFFSFHGILLFNALCIASIYLTGFHYYRNRPEEQTLPALNSVFYFTLLALPVLYLLPSHHLFLLAAITAAISFGLRRQAAWSAVFLAIAASSQPWSILVALFLISYWSQPGEVLPRFLLILGVLLFFVWGTERLMYPPSAVGETRAVIEVINRPVAEVWSRLPRVDTYLLSTPSVRRVMDFAAGRTAGLFLYSFPACALLLTSVWFWRDRLVGRTLMFFVFFLAAISFTDPSCWNIAAFSNDLCMIPAALAFFLFPMIKPVSFFAAITAVSCFVTGPLLVNPLGGIVNRSYYLQAFPYRFFPVELSLLERTGITANPAYQMKFDSGSAFFLNDNFYAEGNFFWVHGASVLELLLRLDQASGKIYLRNGSLDNHVTVMFGGRMQEFWLKPGEMADIDLDPYRSQMAQYQGSTYLHGKIESSNGYVPKLFSRDNPDYRYVGCQIRLEKQ